MAYYGFLSMADEVRKPKKCDRYSENVVSKAWPPTDHCPTAKCSMATKPRTRSRYHAHAGLPRIIHVFSFVLILYFPCFKSLNHFFSVLSFMIKSHFKGIWSTLKSQESWILTCLPMSSGPHFLRTPGPLEKRPRNAKHRGAVMLQPHPGWTVARTWTPIKISRV